MANDKLSKEQILKLIDERSAAAGVDGAALKAIIQQESGFNPSAKNPKSSAAGLGQFISSTAKEMGVTNPYDPVQAINGTIAYAKKTAGALGIPVTRENAGKIYLGHFAGQGGAKKLLSANPNATFESVLGAKAAAANNLTGVSVAKAIDRLGGKVQNFANQWGGGASSSTSSANLSTGTNPSDNFSQQAIQVATQLAGMNRNSMGTFGVNDQDRTQGVVALGNANNTSMNTQADILNQVQRNWSNYETNADGTRKLDSEGQPVKKGLGSKLFDLTLGSGAAALDNMTQKQIQADVLKSVTNAQTLAKQQQALNQESVASPKVFEQAGITAINQQQANDAKANAAATLALNRDKLNADLAQQELLNKYVTEDRNAKNTAELRAAGTAAELDAQMQTAAKQLNVSIPKGLGYDQALALITDPVQKASFATLVLNNGSMGNNLYDAVKLGRTTPGVSDDIRNTAMKYGEFVDNVLSSPAAIARLDGVLNKETGKREGGITDPVQRDIVSRDLVAGALKGISEGTAPADIKYSAMNPYSVAARDDAIYNGVTFAKGLNPTIVANPVSAIRVAWREGASATEIAKTYQDIAGNIDTRLGDANVAMPKVQLRVQIGTQGNGAPRYADMTKPTDVAIIMKRYAMEEAGAPKSSIWENIQGGAAELGDTWNETSFLLRKPNKY